MAQPLAALAGCVSAARARRPLGRRPAGEPVREANVGPAHQALPPANRDADVDRGQRMRQGGLAAAAQIDRRGDEQQQVDERRRDEQRLWRVVLREGIEAASVRKVAAEAGVSKGSLRHVFPSQSELLVFAMQLITDEVARRVAAVDPSGEVRDVVERRLQSLLVLDPETRAVFDVWLAFATRARVDASLRRLRDETHARVRNLCRESVELLRAGGETRSELDVPHETERLHALIDGLAMHATVDPELMTPARHIEILSRHLDTLG
jgi:AcrR family transcriptional regulator